MTIWAVASLHGSPGATTLAMGLGAAWPVATGRVRLVVEADPDGGVRHGGWDVMRSIVRLGRWVAASSVLLVLLVGVPGFLVAAVGWPLPRTVPAWDDITATFTGDLPLDPTTVWKVVACVVWVAWVQVAAAATIEGTALARGGIANPIRGLAHMQGLTGPLLSAAAVLLPGGLGATHAGPSSPPPSAVRTLVAHIEVPALPRPGGTTPAERRNSRGHRLVRRLLRAVGPALGVAATPEPSIRAPRRARWMAWQKSIVRCCVCPVSCAPRSPSSGSPQALCEAASRTRRSSSRSGSMTVGSANVAKTCKGIASATPSSAPRLEAPEAAGRVRAPPRGGAVW